MSQAVIVVGAREASRDLRGRARLIKTELPVVVRQTADSAVRLARHKSTAIMGANNGSRSDSLQKAIQRGRVVSFEVGGDNYYRCLVDIRHLVNRSAYYGRLADPGDYSYFVEHGTTAKIATGHAGGRNPPLRRPPGYAQMTERQKQIADISRATFAHRGNLMVFRESRPGMDRSRWFQGHFFRGQRGKHFMAGSADETSTVIVPQLLRGAGIT